MMNYTHKNNKKSRFLTLSTTILISLLLLSTLTILPSVNGQPVMDKIKEKEDLQTIINEIEGQLDLSETTNTSLLTNLLISLLSKIIGQSIDSELLSNLFNGNTELSFFQNLINIIKGLIQNENGSSDPSENTMLDIIISILKSILTITGTLLKIMLNATISLISGILRIIGAILMIILLVLAGTQTVLTLGAILMLFLGVMSKLGIKALSIIGAPIFALIAAQFTITMGTILGGVSTVLFAILAILMLFALPISIGVIIYLLVGGTEGTEGEGVQNKDINLDFDPNGPLYMLLSILSNSIKSN